jgi:hypothetical protein
METAPKGFTIRIFVPGDSVDGLRIIEKSNWTGRGLVCPRSQFVASKARSDFGRTGVYVLLGPGMLGTLPKVYIGEGDPARPRLEQHYSRKDFWTTVVLFVSKDENLNKAHIQYLESRLVTLAAEANRCELENGNAPALPSLSEIDAAEAEGFLREMLLCFPIIGVNVFEKPARQSAGTELLNLKAKGIEARGYEAGDGFVVLKGSQAVREDVPSIHAFMAQMRRTLRDKDIFKEDGKCWTLTQDYTFDSPSTAAGVLLGRSANGRIEWKAADGRSLKELQSKAAAAAGRSD